MHTVTIQFVIPTEQSDALDHELRHSHVLNDFPVYIWSEEKSTDEEVKWYEEQYLEEELDV